MLSSRSFVLFQKVPTLLLATQRWLEMAQPQIVFLVWSRGFILVIRPGECDFVGCAPLHSCLVRLFVDGTYSAPALGVGGVKGFGRGLPS